MVAGTVDGDVDAETAGGPVRALSVNGDVRAAVHGFADTGAVKVTTVNGSVALELPADVDATVSAQTVNGDITSDFPLTARKKFLHHANGVIGAGGRRVELNAVNGSVHLTRGTSRTAARPPRPPSPPHPLTPLTPEPSVSFALTLMGAACPESLYCRL